MEAERERISRRKGSDAKAVRLYDQAIVSAAKNGFIQNQGLACERAACFNRSRRETVIARIYLNEAWRCYTEWGATAKISHIEEVYDSWWHPPQSSLHNSGSEDSTGAGSLETLDLATINKATRAISSEIDFKALLTALMKIIIENAGAEKGALIMKEKDAVLIKAFSSEAGVVLSEGQPLEENNQLCRAVVQFVIRSGEATVLGNAATEGSFTADPYIRQQQSRSILCLPIWLKDTITGALYLENNLASQAFTERQVALLTSLVSQAAISLENARLFEQEKQMVDRLKEIDRLKDEFLANTSHELKTPLAGIIGLAETLVDRLGKSGSTGELQDLRMIIQSGNRLSGLINDILDFSKLRQRDLKLEIRPLSLESMAGIVFGQCRPLADQKGLQLVSRIPEDLPSVAADENRLQQILFNLLGNAIKFTAVGSIELSAERQGNYVAFSVTDTGMGIPADQLDRIFNLFEQGSGQIQSMHGGTGLGLALARKLVDLHQGSITVNSTPGKGSCFIVTLPVHPDPPETQQSNPEFLPSPYDLENPFDLTSLEEEVAAASADDGHDHVLIVDDDPVILKVLAGYLKGEQIRISFALNGPEALECIEDEKDVDLVLLDVMMPEINGYDICRRLRRHYDTIDLPIILLTARSHKEDVIAGFKAGASDYLVKPVGREELLARVRTQLELKRSVQQLKEHERLQEEIRRREEIEQKLESVQRRILRNISRNEEKDEKLNLGQVQHHLTGIEELLSIRGQELLTQIRQSPASFDTIASSSLQKPDPEQLRPLLSELLSRSLNYWQQTTGKDKLALAEESGLWTATLDPKGTYSTRTLDKYLHTRTLPNSPRWRVVVQTATFVLNHCPDTAPELKKTLQEKLQVLEQMLLKSHY